jgi:hypothetical protein
MPMGIVSDSEFESELNKPNTVQAPSIQEKVHVPVVIKDMERGRTPGAVGVPDGLRKIIGDESVTNGREAAIALARDFGISESSVSAYAKGATSTASYNDRPNAGVINSAKERISKKARARLMMSLNLLTEDKFADAKARDIAAVAKDMSTIVRNMEPPPSVNPTDSTAPRFVVYSPQFKQETHYQTLVVKE